MRRRRLPATKRFALALILLAGCASGPIDNESWQDATYDEVVAQWGPPASSSKLDDGTDVHLWISERVAAVSSGPTVGFGVFGGSGRVGSGVGIHLPVGPPPDPQRCERRLYFTAGRVVDEEWLGDPGVCKDFRRH
jgi:hypothetical protein